MNDNFKNDRLLKGQKTLVDKPCLMSKSTCQSIRKATMSLVKNSISMYYAPLRRHPSMSAILFSDILTIPDAMN